MNTVRIGVFAFLLLALNAKSASAQTNVPFRFPHQPPGFGSHWPGVLTNGAWSKRRVDLRFSTFDLRTNFVIAKVETGEEPPAQIAVVIKQLKTPRAKPAPSPWLQSGGASPSREQIMAAAEARRKAFDARIAEEAVDWKQATWTPFTPTVPIDLGPGEGRRVVWIAGKWDGQGFQTFQTANATHVRVRLTPPHITITNPVQSEVSQPMIQLQGYSDEPLRSIRYDVLNASNHVADAQGFVNAQEFEPGTVERASSYFTCYDIDLSLGTNTIVLRCEDDAGNVSTDRFTYVFTLDHKPPPVMTLDSPRNGEHIVGDIFTARGRLNDPTARITALVSANGRTNSITGLVERNGYFWVEQIPLGPGANALTITATDAAGQVCSTNLVVYKGEGVLSMDPVPGDKLWQHDVTVTGKVKPSNQRVLINGVEAQVKPDGTWVAYKVPILSPNGGTAVFEMTALPLTGSGGAHATNNPATLLKPQELVSVSAGLGTNAMTLNVGRPACSSFNLHLSDTGGRSFILEASTNLVDWTPILTNLNSEPVFDFTDTNTANYKCRFFRVVPLP